MIYQTEGNVRKIQKRAPFHYRKVKKGTLNLTSPYVIASYNCFGKIDFL